MNMTDPIADMLTRIRNATMARHSRVLIPASNMKIAIAQILKEEGYIKDFDVVRDTPQGTLRVSLKYVDKRPVLTQLKRISKPGLRVYAKSKDMPRILGGLGVAIVSTPQGVMTAADAKRANVGGEILCYVW